MKSILLYILLLIGIATHAQNITAANIIGGQGNQYRGSVYIDYSGNRYLIINCDRSITLDSLGFPITVTKNSTNLNERFILIVKYNSSLHYLYHIKIEQPAYLLDAGHSSISFTTQNDVVLYFLMNLRSGTPSIDSFQLSDSKGLIPDKFKITACQTRRDAVLCKLDSNGIYQWANLITNENPYDSLISLGYNLFQSIPHVQVHQNDEIVVFFNNKASLYGTIDTITVIKLPDIKTLRVGQAVDTKLTFASDGTLLNYSEPLKNRVSAGNLYRPANLINITNAVSDGHNTYMICYLSIVNPDTFRCPTPFVLSNGGNILLIKMDDNDNVIWGKPIGLATGNKTGYHISFSKSNNEILIGFSFNTNSFLFSNGLSYVANNGNDIYLARLDTNGNILWNSIYSGGANDILNSISFNERTSQLVIVGATSSSSFQFGNIILTNNPGAAATCFIGVLDSLNNSYSAQSINSKTANFETHTQPLPYDIGDPIDQSTGEIVVVGSFLDSIAFPCKTAYTHPDNTPGASDIFIITLPSVIRHDTSVCRSLISPSTLYSWDSSGLYYDTIPNHLGCDSVLLFKVTLYNPIHPLIQPCVETWFHSVAGIPGIPPVHILIPFPTILVAIALSLSAYPFCKRIMLLTQPLQGNMYRQVANTTGTLPLCT